MEKQKSEQLYRVSLESLENLCGMFPVEGIEKNAKDPFEVGTRVDFIGPIQGKTYLLVYGELWKKMTEPMLDSKGEEEEKDALGEILNVIAGNFLPFLAGPKAEFRIMHPEVFEDKSSLVGQNPVAKAMIQLEKGRIELLVFSEDVG